MTSTTGRTKSPRSFGAKVFREPWKGHSPKRIPPRQRLRRHGFSDLDADEVVSPELREEIQRGFAARTPSPWPRSVFPAAPFIAGAGFATATGIPTGRPVCGGAARRNGAAWIPHDKLIVDGQVGRLQSNLQHFSNDSVNAHIQKIIPFTDEYVRQHSQGQPGSPFSGLAIRPVWRFVRAYFLRLGFLDGWQGGYIAWLNAFSTASKYAKLRERQLKTRGVP